MASQALLNDPLAIEKKPLRFNLDEIIPSYYAIKTLFKFCFVRILVVFYSEIIQISDIT